MATQRYSARTNAAAIEQYARLLQTESKAPEERDKRPPAICRVGLPGCQVVLAPWSQTSCRFCTNREVE
jgi:hypothetical protein